MCFLKFKKMMIFDVINKFRFISRLDCQIWIIDILNI